ncbi:MAG: hypothetical protein ACKOTF_11235 [Opitutaceae bacterium]
MRPDPSTERPGTEPLPSWLVGLCGVAAFGSLLFTLLLFLNR